MKIILGSSSPRRKIILQNLIDKFDICSPNIEEIALSKETPMQFSERISEEKGKSIFQNISNPSQSLIISCDTIVTINSKIIGKPLDYQDAVNIIKTLNGNTHEVISSITLLHIDGVKTRNITDSEVSRITFKKITNNDIMDYLKKIDYSDKAGAYAVQEHGDSIIHSIEGSITNVIGFPVRLFFKMLSKLNLLDEIFL
jgi:septum formation protein